MTPLLLITIFVGGFGAMQSDGFDSGETRSLDAEQDPEGVPEGSGISTCYPSFSTIESG